MKKRKAAIINLYVLPSLAATLTAPLLFSWQAPEEAIVMPVAKVLGLS
jgi:hypothetical protein